MPSIFDNIEQFLLPVLLETIQAPDFAKTEKVIVDEIDRVLAKHYGFTDEDLDFIINYDIKYRMG